MKTIVIGEYGYDEAVLGFSLSYNSTIERAKELLPVYAFKTGGENKFLESIYLWLDVTAPRFWWQEADTYRVGTSKQSESTMHTLTKAKLTQDNFEYPIPNEFLSYLNTNITIFNGDKNLPKIVTIEKIKNILPEGFLQRRMWCLNYRTLQNMYAQRATHRLPQWHKFLIDVFFQIEHPEFVAKDIGENDDNKVHVR